MNTCWDIIHIPFKSTLITHLKCAIQWLLLNYSFAATPTINFRTFSSLPKRNRVPISSHTPFLPYLLISKRLLTFCLYGFVILDLSDKWNHLWLASFTWYNIFKVHPCCGMYQYFIPVYNQRRIHCMGLMFYLSLIILTGIRK